MNAIVVRSFGGPEALRYEGAPDPEAKAGELLVRVRAVGVNPVETYIRSGAYATLPALPYVPGGELAGVVVDGPRKGERVFALGTAAGRNAGAYAELAAVAEGDVYRLADHLTFAQGAAIPVAFGTAWRALFDRGELKPGQTVLVHGASGGVGTAATQLAAAHGAVVVGTASTPVGRRAATNGGASFVVSHRDVGYRDQIKAFTGGRGVDVIIEMLANVNLDHDLDLLAPGGRVVVVGNRGRVEIDPRKTMAKESSLTGVMLWAGGDAALRRAFAGVSALLARRAVTPVVGTELPLAEAAKAHELVMSDAGSAGKIVLIV